MKYSEILADRFTDILKCPVCGADVFGNENKKSILHFFCVY